MLSSDELARDVQGAEDMMERHQEIRAEIDARNEKYVQPHNYAQIYIYTHIIIEVLLLKY